jgi:probable rRNA maturation factor
MILNRQRTVRIARPALESFLRRVRRQLGLGRAEVTICLVTDAEISRMNESFPRRRPVRLPARSTARFLGDIAISPATARRNARRYGRTLPTELQILILHGVLHLLGYDHETDRGQMDRVEHRLRRRLGLA